MWWIIRKAQDAWDLSTIDDDNQSNHEFTTGIPHNRHIRRVPRGKTRITWAQKIGEAGVPPRDAVWPRKCRDYVEGSRRELFNFDSWILTHSRRYVQVRWRILFIIRQLSGRRLPSQRLDTRCWRLAPWCIQWWSSVFQENRRWLDCCNRFRKRLLRIRELAWIGG